MKVQTFTNTQNEQLKNIMVTQTAVILHDNWRKKRLQPDGSYEPRMKPDGEGGEVDIANTGYVDLPQKWQAENKAAAQFVVNLLLSTSNTDMEQLSAQVHDDWLSRNGQWAPPEQNVPYDQLSEDDKQLDRDVVTAGQKVVQEHSQQIKPNAQER